jgi:hypothetical protein
VQHNFERLGDISSIKIVHSELSQVVGESVPTQINLAEKLLVEALVSQRPPHKQEPRASSHFTFYPLKLILFP